MKRAASRLAQTTVQSARRLGHWSARAYHHRAFRISLIVLALLGLGGAWAATLIEHSVDKQDPAAVAAQYVSDLQQDKPNHAYTLMSPAMQKLYGYSSQKFATQGAPSIADAWPRYQADHIVNAQTQKPKNNDTKFVMFVIPSDGEVKAQQVQIRLTRSKAGEPWQVDAVSSITHINGKIAPGAL